MNKVVGIFGFGRVTLEYWSPFLSVSSFHWDVRNSFAPISQSAQVQLRTDNDVDSFQSDDILMHHARTPNHAHTRTHAHAHTRTRTHARARTHTHLHANVIYADSLVANILETRL